MTDGQAEKVERQRSKFAGGDQEYLRDEQYRDAGRLAQRANLHARYGTSSVSWFDWVTERFRLEAESEVLEVGCGAGWLWAETNVALPGGVALTLTDLSAGMVDEALQRVESTGRFAELSGRTADLMDLPFATDSYDRVIANHMLYHLPDPDRGVAELARIVRSDGVVVAATNGRRHMKELWQIRGEMFDIELTDRTIDVFGADTGFAVLRDHFEEIAWEAFRDELRCTDPADVLDYVCSTPPGEDASAADRARLEAMIRAAFDEGDGVMTITKDVGCFVCRAPVSH